MNCKAIIALGVYLFLGACFLNAEQALSVESQASVTPALPVDTITIAILAKDKAHTLPLYLQCIEQQTWPAKKTNLYIRTNNNNDKTAEILEAWVEKVRSRYAIIYFDKTNVENPVQKYGQHEWNEERFKVLGKIRQESIDWARAMRSHYFVVDCDNFIKPDTLEKIAQPNLPIVAPFMICYQTMNVKNSVYSNYHAAITSDGYYADCPEYYVLWNQDIKGLIEVPVVHCSYFIRYDVLDKISYDDGSYRYEYVIFSDVARKYNISQYLDNRETYGYITFAENELWLQGEPWLEKFSAEINYKQALNENC